jgi:hypothetical protein
MTMRHLALLLATLVWSALACGCGGESDKKGINKDKDRPVPQPPKAAAPAGPHGVAAKDTVRRGI